MWKWYCVENYMSRRITTKIISSCADLEGWGGGWERRGGGGPENSNIWKSISKFTEKRPRNPYGRHNYPTPSPLNKNMDLRKISTKNFSYDCNANTLGNDFLKCLLHRTQRSCQFLLLSSICTPYWYSDLSGLFISNV